MNPFLPVSGGATILARRNASAAPIQDSPVEEEQASEALPERKPSRITTPLGHLKGLIPGAPPRQVRAAVDESISAAMAAMKRGRLDCLLLDRVEYLTAFDGVIWDRLIELLEDGTLLSLGFSVRTPAEAHSALDNRDVCHLQLPFNVLDWRWQESGVVERIRARPGVTVHARNVLLHGLLAEADPARWAIDEDVDPTNILQCLQTLTRILGRASVADLCVAYVRGQDWVDGTVHTPDIGGRDIELPLSLQRPLNPGECAAVMQRMPRVPERFLLEEPLPERAYGAPLDRMRNS